MGRPNRFNFGPTNGRLQRSAAKSRRSAVWRHGSLSGCLNLKAFRDVSRPKAYRHVVRKVLKKVGPIRQTMESRTRSRVSRFRHSRGIRKISATVRRSSAAGGPQVEMAVDVLKLYTPIEVKVVPATENPVR
jgi:hypothetical protein